jgi:uncharacterized protein with HEPN domain
MLQAVQRIRDYLDGLSEMQFIGDALRQDAVIRNLEIIGEAAGKVSSELHAVHSDMPWADIAGMRHRLIHGYFAVDLAIVWATVKRDLPRLEEQVRSILSNAERS